MNGDLFAVFSRGRQSERRRVKWGTVMLLVSVTIGVVTLVGCGDRQVINAPSDAEISTGAMRETGEQLFAVTLGGLTQYEELRSMFGAGGDAVNSSLSATPGAQMVGRLNLWLSQRSESEWNTAASVANVGVANTTGTDTDLPVMTMDPLAEPWADGLAAIGKNASAIAATLVPVRNEFLLRSRTTELNLLQGRLYSLVMSAKDTVAGPVAGGPAAISGGGAFDSAAAEAGLVVIRSTETAFQASISRMREVIREFRDEKQLENLELTAADALIQRVGRRDAWESLMPLRRIAAVLNYPDRFRDADYFAGWLAELRRLAASPAMPSLTELCGQYHQVVAGSPGGRPTRTSIQLEIVMLAMEQIDEMDRLAALMRVRADLEQTAAGLYAVRGSGIAEEKTILSLADRLVKAARKPDMQELADAVGELTRISQPSQNDALVRLAHTIRPCAESMTPLIVQMEQFALDSGLRQVGSLVTYTKSIQSVLNDVAKELETSGVESDSREIRILEIGRQFELAGDFFVKEAAELEYYAKLGGRTLAESDERILREAAMLRDLAHWCRGDDTDDLARVGRLFDWVFHEIAADDGRIAASMNLLRMQQFPIETMFYGRGNLEERCELFTHLVRQIGLDAVMLGLETTEIANGTLTNGTHVPWVIGVLIGGELYLFDPELEIPIPAPGDDAISLGPDGALVVRPATLAQTLDMPEVLDRLAIDATHPYPYSAKSLAVSRIVAMIAAPPSSLAARMRVVENNTSGGQRLQIVVHPSSLAERLRKVRGIADVRLWEYPWETRIQRVALGSNFPALQRAMIAPFDVIPGEPLLRGRLLHLRGVLASGEDDEATAVSWYRQATPTTAELRAIADFVGLIQDPTIRAQQQRQLAALEDSKQNAEFWSGQITLRRGLFRSAEDFLNRRTLADGQSNPWCDAGRELLVLTYERQKEYVKAADVCRTDATPESWRGRFLRARWGLKLAGIADHEPPLPGFVGDAGLVTSDGIDSTTQLGTGEMLPGLPELPGLTPEAPSPAEPEKTSDIEPPVTSEKTSDTEPPVETV